MIEGHESQQLISINLANGRRSQLAVAYGTEAGGTATIGPVIDWQPVR